MKIILWKIGKPEGVDCLPHKTLEKFGENLRDSLRIADELHLVVGPEVSAEVITVSDFGGVADEYQEKIVIHDGVNMHVVHLEGGEPLEDV